MRVKVYRNLKHGRHAPPLYSIMHNGRVIARRHEVLLTDATFKVNEAGRQRVIKEGRKNVHAFVVGNLADEQGAFGQDATGPDLPVPITYNPFLAGEFCVRHGRFNGRTVKHASVVLLNAHGITAAYVD